MLQATSIPMMWRCGGVVWFGANVCIYLVFLTWCHELIQLLFNKDQVTSPTKTLQADLNDKLPSLCCEKKCACGKTCRELFLIFFRTHIFLSLCFQRHRFLTKHDFPFLSAFFRSFLFNYFHLFIIPLTYFICVACGFFFCLFFSQQVFQALIEWYSSIKAILNIFIIFKLKVDGPSHPENVIYVLSFMYTYLVHNWKKKHGKILWDD